MPSVASVAERGTNLLRACLKDADVPLMVCATGIVFKASTGLLKSVSSPFESFAVTESIREIWADQELRACLNTVHPHTVLSHVDRDTEFKPERVVFFLQPLSNTCRSGCKKKKSFRESV